MQDRIPRATAAAFALRRRDAGVTLIEFLVGLLLFSAVSLVAFELLKLSRAAVRKGGTTSDLQQQGRLSFVELARLIGRMGDGTEDTVASNLMRNRDQPIVVFADDYTLVFTADLDEEVTIRATDVSSTAAVEDTGPLTTADVQLMHPDDIAGRWYYWYLAGPNGRLDGLTNSDDPLVHPGANGVWYQCTPGTCSAAELAACAVAQPGLTAAERTCDDLAGNGGTAWFDTRDRAGNYEYSLKAGANRIWGDGDELWVHPGHDGVWTAGGGIDANMTGAGPDITWGSSDDLTGPGRTNGGQSWHWGPATGAAVTQRDPADGRNWDLTGAETIVVTMDRNGDGQVDYSDRCAERNFRTFAIGYYINSKAPADFVTIACGVRGPVADPNGDLVPPVFQYWLNEDIDGDAVFAAPEIDFNQNGEVDIALLGDHGSCTGCVAANGILEQGEIFLLVAGLDGIVGGAAAPDAVGSAPGGAVPDEMGGPTAATAFSSGATYRDRRVPWYYREKIDRITVELTMEAAEPDGTRPLADGSGDVYPYFPSVTYKGVIRPQALQRVGLGGMAPATTIIPPS
ncbi:MAG: prepilin-type N-terminal cleavage/methylation domain-containing protein [Candidatus Schekmanbacteria bacterium]|nr:prepilin-type N-terminal cleavage/methylation domain-containing protein [Candidatus Schekmanbacteria bacterium]